MNILVVSAHHDDLELGCGGAVAKMLESGHQVISLVFTGSGYKNVMGDEVRNSQQALSEGRDAARTLGYKLIAHNEDALDLRVTDANVCKIIDIIQKYNVDTLFTHWPGDTHPVHQRVATMAVQASRRVPRVFGFAVNWYIGVMPLHMTTFISIEERHWQKKLAALSCYKSEFARTGAAWVDYLDRQTRNYGTQFEVYRAEAFVTLKNLMQIHSQL